MPTPDRTRSASRRRRFSPRVLCGILLLGTASAWYQSGPAQRDRSEYEVKAAFLLNFTRFIEWPPADAPAGDPFHICILGDDRFIMLDTIVAGERVGSRPIEVRRLRRWQPPCQILFISDSVRDVFPILRRLGPGVLTVGESPRFLSEGGMINFVVENRKVRFDINQKAARDASLKMSSRLLNVARRVIP